MTYMEELLAAIRAGAPMTTAQIVSTELEAWLHGPKRAAMLAGQRYYEAHNNILDCHRTVIGKDGVPERPRNMADNHLCHAFLPELVDQKIQYLLGKPYSLQCQPERLTEQVCEALGEDFQKLLARLARDAVNKGIGWLYVYYDEDGSLALKRMEPEEMLPLWADRDHTRLDGMIRCYPVECYEGRTKRIREKVELWTQTGVEYFERYHGTLTPDPDHAPGPMMTDAAGKGWNWERLPFLPLKYNDLEQPLLCRIQSLVDEYDRVATGDSNTLQDQPNSILVVRNYDGTDLGEFRRNLVAYRAVKVSDAGGLEALTTPLDVEASNRHLERIRRDIYAFGRGVDTRNERLAGSPSGVALKHEYAQLDLDCNALEQGVRSLVQGLMWFVGVTLGLAETPRVRLVCNRDILISEEAAIAMCQESQGIVSRRTVLENHPWVEEVQEEMQRLREERPEETGQPVSAAAVPTDGPAAT